METQGGGKTKKGRGVITYIPEDLRESLKIVASFKGMLLFELLETVLRDHVRAWEKLHKIDLSDIRSAERRSQRTSRKKS